MAGNPEWFVRKERNENQSLSWHQENRVYIRVYICHYGHNWNCDQPHRVLDYKKTCQGQHLYGDRFGLSTNLEMGHARLTF